MKWEVLNRFNNVHAVFRPNVAAPPNQREMPAGQHSVKQMLESIGVVRRDGEGTVTVGKPRAANGAQRRGGSPFIAVVPQYETRGNVLQQHGGNPRRMRSALARGTTRRR